MRADEKLTAFWKWNQLFAPLVVELSLVKTSCVETLDYSGYEHSQNYGLIATTLQLFSSSIECVVR